MQSQGFGPTLNRSKGMRYFPIKKSGASFGTETFPNIAFGISQIHPHKFPPTVGPAGVCFLLPFTGCIGLFLPLSLIGFGKQKFRVWFSPSFFRHKAPWFTSNFGTLKCFSSLRIWDQKVLLTKVLSFFENCLKSQIQKPLGGLFSVLRVQYEWCHSENGCN